MNSPLQTTPYFPAPWQLKGTGYIFLCRFPAEFVERYAGLSGMTASGFKGGLGTLMVVDYAESDAGPYQELLFIPGRFKLAGQGCFHIPKIYVSSEASIVNGRRNWAIPKEQADFEFVQNGREESVHFSRNGVAGGHLRIKTLPIKMPITTALLPAGLRTFIQPSDSGLLKTVVRAHGMAQAIRVQEINFTEAFFPPVQPEHILLGVKVPVFHMTFPVAESLPLPMA